MKAYLYSLGYLVIFGSAIYSINIVKTQKKLELQELKESHLTEKRDLHSQIREDSFRLENCKLNLDRCRNGEKL